MLPPNMGYGTGNLRPPRKPKKPKGPKKSPKPRKPPAPPAPQYGPLRRRAEHEANIRYRPQQQALNQQLLNVTGTPQAPGWFDQYKASVAAAGQQIAGRYTNAQTAIDNRQLVAPAAGMNPELQQAMAAQGAVRDAFSNLLTNASIADQNYYTGRGTVADAAKLSAQLDTQALINALLRERGEYVQTRRAELKDERHTRRLENKAFGLDVAKAQADTVDKALSRRQERREKRRQRREEGQKVNQYGFSEKDWRGMSVDERRKIIRQDKTSGSSTTRKTPFSGKDQAKSRQSFRRVYNDIKRNDNGTQDYGPEIRKTLTNAGADSLLVRAAWQLYKSGSVNENIARALYRDYGIRVKRRKGGAKRPDPYTPPADFPGSDIAQG